MDSREPREDHELASIIAGVLPDVHLSISDGNYSFAARQIASEIALRRPSPVAESTPSPDTEVTQAGFIEFAPHHKTVNPKPGLRGAAGTFWYAEGWIGGERMEFAAPNVTCRASAERLCVTLNTAIEAFARLRTAQNTGRDEVLEALTPSAETKAAYMGEFSFVIPQAQEDEHGEAIEVDQRVYVPWTTIKEIMAAIKTRALSSPPDSTVDEEGGGS